MNKQNLAIITNEKTYFNNNSYFCDNIDMKSIPEGLDSKYNLQLFVRNSKLERSTHQINLKNIFILITLSTSVQKLNIYSTLIIPSLLC